MEKSRTIYTLYIVKCTYTYTNNQRIIAQILYYGREMNESVQVSFSNPHCTALNPLLNGIHHNTTIVDRYGYGQYWRFEYIRCRQGLHKSLFSMI